MTTSNSKAQELTKNYPLEKDVLTIDGIIKAFYDSCSGEAGEKKKTMGKRFINSQPNAFYSYLTM
jgi:hypothetical protein